VAIYNTALNSNQVLAHFYAAHTAPVFTLQPTNTTANESGSATLYSSAYGPPVQGYQWYQSLDSGSTFNPIGGNTNNLVLAALPSAWDQSQYYVVATNTYGATTSSVATLSVSSGAPFVQIDLPAQTYLYAGRTLVLSVGVGGTAPLTYQWTSNGVNLANGGRVSGATSNVLVIANTLASDSATYQLSATNNAGGPALSTACQVTISGRPTFNTTGVGWTGNGTSAPGFADNTLTLTAQLGSTARSAFFNFPLYIQRFAASFVYQCTNTAGADGATFVIHNDTRGTTAVGAAGGSLGYAGITPSVALAINIYNPNTVGISFRQNGTLPAGGAGAYAPVTPVNLIGNPIKVDALYDGSVLKLTFTDLTTLNVFNTNYTVNIPSIVGSSTAYVGFTGADGGIASTQTISNFTFVPFPAITLQSAPNSLTMTWPASIGGFVPQSRPSLTTGSWTDVAALVSQVGSNMQVTISPLTGNESYFRLNLP
jgi:hypothetical protein